MKSLSIFQRAQRWMAAGASSIDLGTVGNVSRRDFDEHETLLFRTQVPCMEYVSLLIENAVLLRTNRAGRVYVGFEKLSRMEPIVDRYLRIADVSERVYVFGVNDWSPPRHPRLKVVGVLPGSELSREWFVIADSPSYRVALAARDEDGFDTPVLENRYFSAVKTNSPAFVTALAEEAEILIDLA